VSFRNMDMLQDGSPGRFGLILCCNAAFTYFGPDQRLSVAVTLVTSLEEGDTSFWAERRPCPKRPPISSSLLLPPK
jgi:chemotaxis methyl-accepting protein methylase